MPGILSIKLDWRVMSLLRLTDQNLRLKHMWFATNDGQQFFGRIEPGNRIVVRLDIVNVGKTNALITVINFVTLIISVGERLPQRPPYNEAPANLPGRIEIPGFSLQSGITFTQAVSDNRVLTAEELQGIRQGLVRLYFVGTVEYWDSAGINLRQTAFCRYLSFNARPAHDEDMGRFQRDKDPDYEYQD